MVKNTFLYFSAAFIVIAATVFVLVERSSPPIDEKWYLLEANSTKIAGIPKDAEPGTKPVSWNISDEVFNQFGEIAPPTIRAVTGKAKFLYQDANPKSDKVNVGYVLEVAIDPTDLKYVADKYKHEREDKTLGASIPALQNAAYKISFELVLLDKDGFVLSTLQSPQAYAVAGNTTSVQDKIETLVPMRIAQATTRIAYTVTVDKNLSLE